MMTGIRIECEYDKMATGLRREWIARAYRGTEQVAIGYGSTELHALRMVLDGIEVNP